MHKYLVNQTHFEEGLIIFRDTTLFVIILQRRRKGGWLGLKMLRSLYQHLDYNVGYNCLVSVYTLELVDPLEFQIPFYFLWLLQLGNEDFWAWADVRYLIQMVCLVIEVSAFWWRSRVLELDVIAFVFFCLLDLFYYW